MATNSVSEQLLNDLGEEFAERLRRGESPSVSEYTSRFPAEQASEVAEFLDSIAMLESLKPGANPDERASNQTDEIPETFGRYRIERSLGEGGMGTVYLAHDSQLDRKVALKTPKFATNSKEILISRFYREARSAATLQHPNICPVYDVGEIDGIHYISMAYIEGRPLSDYIKSKKFPPVSSVLRIVRKVALALHEAHANGFLHRDLKPANIMIDRRNEPIVMDFGLARQFGSDESEADSTSEESAPPSQAKQVEARLTMDGTIVGSPGYMSPEQLRGEHVVIGPASDVYALGVLLYELLTRELPFPGDGSLMSVVKSVFNDEPPDASRIRAQLDPGIASICQKAMAKMPEDRYASMQAFAVALTEVLKSDAGDGQSPKISEAANDSSSPELVRTREQYELARSLYQEGQFAAAVSILQKMVAGTDERPNQYTTWAQGELPKARAKAKQATSEESATDFGYDDDFWNDDADDDAVGTVSFGPTSTRTRKSKSKKKTKKSTPGWLFGIASLTVAGVLLVIAVSMANRFFGDLQPDTPVTAATTPSTDAAGSTDDKQSEKAKRKSSNPRKNADSRELRSQDRPGGKGKSKTRPNTSDGQTPSDRLWRLDTNNDQKISKAELTVRRMPQAGILKRVAENFDQFDILPQDGVLDRIEIQRMLRMLSRPGGPRENRGRSKTQ